MNIVGISAFYHDSAAALIKDGRIVAAAQEERFNRKKNYSGFPAQALIYCLTAAALTSADIDYIVFYEKPLAKFSRILGTILTFAPHGFGVSREALTAWSTWKLRQKSHLIRCLEESGFTRPGARLNFVYHHHSHAASAFYPSPFHDAAILTMDGVGEWATTAISRGTGNQISFLQELHFPHSLGLLYSAFTDYLGFKVDSAEYKVMGLAAYGEPIFAKVIRSTLIDVKTDGSFALNMDYFAFCVDKRMTNSAFHALFGRASRTPDEPVTQFHRDIASSVQAVTSEVMCLLARQAKHATGASNLCLAGGVALNCVGNGAIQQLKLFDRIWIQPAAGDAGGAVGAALLWHYQQLRNKREAGVDGMRGAYLGPEFTNEEIATELSALNARYSKHSESALQSEAAEAIANGKIVGWFQGRMEFGPRALGNRSILADARRPEMPSRINAAIKFRESFRPFAPAVLAAQASDWFAIREPSPYMVLTYDVLQTTKTNKSKRAKPNAIPAAGIPAVTHVDGTARVQTVHETTNARFHQLITALFEKTGVPIVLNTSFNVRGEPIVCTPADAYRCFLGTDMDMLVIGNYILHRKEQPQAQSDHADLFGDD